MSERDDDLTPEDIARLDKREYKDPKRDLMATKPATAKGAGAVGDVDNPVADEHSHGMSDKKYGTMGRDEPGGKRRDD